MDISKASNFERFIFDLLGRDATRTAELFGSRVPEGGFSLSDDPAFSDVSTRYGFRASTSTHADRLRIIAELNDAGVLIDPHTADGVAAARRLAGVVDTPIVCLETALPVKFSDTIREAIGTPPPLPERFAGIEDVEFRVFDLPNDPEAVRAFIDAHTPALD